MLIGEAEVGACIAISQPLVFEAEHREVHHGLGSSLIPLLAKTVKLCEGALAMKNITVSIDDDLYRQARIKAAEQSTSISALFKNFLIRLTVSEATETEFQRLAREERELFADLDARRIGLNPAYNLSRDELHDRDALR